ncbi:MAG: radical SAM protein [Candidatus Omnitrophica bacterium]|jgi:MoaA/NifB/PqqE/SkfB family radical SAM enzyme|nr:radical SAM protein [Candidatus Omnitrophota bacterium]
MLKKLLFYLNWFYRCRFKGEKVPLNSSIIITDECNLNCVHCSVAHLGYQKQSYVAVASGIEMLYRKGSRMLVITGGEPFLWNDAKYNLDSIVKFAKALGFFRIVVCTNGTFQLESKADYLWVSLDGEAAEHNTIRGNVYTCVLDNLKKSGHKGIYINFTISALNFKTFEQSAAQIFKIKNIKGIFFHIFTPYLGSDNSLILGKEQRNVMIEKLMKIKSKHPFRVVNTFDGLKYLKNNKWKRPVWSSITVNQGQVGLCCCRKGIYDESVCSRCGCSPAVESFVLQEFKIAAVIENLRFL